MPEINLEYLNSLSEEEQQALQRRFPSVFWIPNRAQERPFSRWRKPPYPRVHIITFGNRTGKTESLGEFLCGVVKGSNYVNPKYCRSEFFDALDEKRRNGTLTVWWVCIADMMKKNAPNYKIIQKHIPDAQFKSRNNNGVYREIWIPVMGEHGKPINIVVPVKTHDQDGLAYAGENVDVIICDEPPPQNHWAEMSGRIVTLFGEVGGRIVIGGTPLKIGGFLLDIIDDAKEDDNIVHDEGSIWENCHGSELPDDMAKKYNIPWDPVTGMYDTRGHLSVEGIRAAISNWQKSGDPEEINARVDGKFTHVQGRIYKIFNKTVHVIPPYTLPKNYPIVQIVDPHDTRPDCAGWYMITPSGKMVTIAEYPTRPFELCTSRAETIPQTCDLWRDTEAAMGIESQVVLRIGDPNYMNDPDPYTGKTKKQLYADHGFVFMTNINDRLEYGHEKVRQFLFYDKVRFESYPEDPLYQPRLLFFSTCRNHIVFMAKYSTVENKDPAKAIKEAPDQKWKDFPDLVRYAVVGFRPYEVLKATMEKGNYEWGKIKHARDPFSKVRA